METERTLLRHWNSSDAPRLFELAKDKEIGPNCGWNPHRDVKESEFIINNVFNGKYCFCIVDKKTNLPIGNIEILNVGHTKMIELATECELGFWLGRNYWNQGIMTEVVEFIVDYCFKELKMNAIYCHYEEGNVQAKAVEDKVGFKYDHSESDVYRKLIDKYCLLHFTKLERN